MVPTSLIIHRRGTAVVRSSSSFAIRSEPRVLNSKEGEEILSPFSFSEKLRHSALQSSAYSTAHAASSKQTDPSTPAQRSTRAIVSAWFLKWAQFAVISFFGTPPWLPAKPYPTRAPPKRSMPEGSATFWPLMLVGQI